MVDGDYLPVIWRTKLRSTRPDPPVNHAEQVAHCVRSGLIGIGWGLDNLVDGSPLDVVLAAIENRSDPGWGVKAATIVRRFAVEAKIGDFVWTRDTSGRYLLCRITGEHRYDATATASAVDVYQVRQADWAPEPLNDLDVPGGVIRCFIGTGESFSRIHNPGARRLTLYLWEKLHGRPLPYLGATPEEILTSYLDPYDVEDLVYVWMQVERGYLALPRARQHDTPAYEYTMIHRGNGQRAIAQIKTGSTPVDLEGLQEAVADQATDTYAFATSGSYRGEPSMVTEVIATEELLRFVREHDSILPPRVRTWFRLADH